MKNDIIIVDDEHPNLQLLAELLSREGYQIRPANDPQLAIESALAQPPQLILLDVKMPQVDGFEVCRRLKQDPRTKDVPVIFISALQEVEDKIHGFKIGGVDFITKPFQQEEVLARVRTHMELRTMRMDLEELVLRRSEELASSEAKYRGLVNNSLVGVFHSTLDGRYKFVNEAMARMFDFDEPEQMLDQGSLKRWQNLEDRERMLDQLQRYGEVVNFEIDALTKSDRLIHVIFSGKLVDESIYGMAMDITERRRAETELLEAHAKIKKLQRQLQAESTYLQEEIKLEHDFDTMIGHSEALNYVLHRIEMVAPQDSAVIILGETGTGKELVARALHQLSSRNGRPLMKVNCAALPGDLIESELFGREKGAFTGATTTQIGRFELADKSTILLDEIGELPYDLQAKLLRVLETGQFERLGNPRTFQSDVRIIAATNRDLEAEVRQGRFREDLWYRLKIFPITVPPLRSRSEDIPLLVDHFVQLLAKRMGKKPGEMTITKATMSALQSYPWPGNVRELKHAVESAMITSRGHKLQVDLPAHNTVGTAEFMSLEDMEREYILEVLQAKNWKVGGTDSAAEILGMPPSTLRSRMKKLEIKKR